VTRTPPGRLALIALFAAAPAARPAAACTTAVVSGRATADGRPILWKNRDAPEQNNRVVHSDGPGHAYLAVVNAGSGGAVWMGVNEKGFCVENSVVKDMPRGGKGGLGNGEFMRHALATCATVAEFEALLKKTNETGRGTQANFGVIDAAGGAAIFETGHVSFVKFDANDPVTAPHGYVVRSNFTMTGTGEAKLRDGGDLADVYSGNRYLRADALVRDGVKAGTFDPRYVLRHCARDLADAQGRPVRGSVNGPPGPLPPAVDTDATIGRRTTVSVGVFHGVRPGEDPQLTTLWVMLGDPAFAVAVPCWVRAGGVAAPLKGDRLSPLCSAALDLRRQNYDAAGKLLQTPRLPRLWAKTWELEDAIVRDTERQLARWRKAAPKADEVAAFHREVGGRALDLLASLREKPALAPAPREVPAGR
jgi:hypothetical protein